MASIHERTGSKKWHCSFRDSAGKWRFVSTKTEDKAEALAVCARLETLAKQTAPKAEDTVPAEDSGELLEAGLKLIQTAKAGALSEATARDFVNRVLKASGAEAEIAGETVRDFFKNWLEGKQVGSAPDTFLRYRSTVDSFLAGLDKRASLTLSAIGSRDIETFRNSRLKEVGVTTVKDDLKIIRTAFNKARKQGMISTNPCEAVDFPIGEAQVREPFNVQEVGLLVQEAPKEWKTVILLGFYAGLRLGDAVRLDWRSVDFEKGMLTFKAQKTGKQESLPIHPMLAAHLGKIAGDTGGKISPSLAKLSIAGRSGLSRQFLDIVREAGLDTGAEEKKREGKRRRFTAKTFHSLRHGFVSSMANAGVSKELRMKLAGHSSDAVASGYTHHEAARLREAVEAIK
jgi:integrase